MADAYAIAASGMAAQQTAMDLIAANLANVSTTRTAHGGPYRTQTAVLETAAPFGQTLESAQLEGADSLLATPDLAFETDEWATPPGVEVTGVVQSSRSGVNGNEADVDPIEQMVALVAAGRNYDANVAVLQAAKQMDMEASDISRLA